LLFALGERAAAFRVHAVHQAVLTANATGISCDLYWNGKKIAISNSPDALCL
jgi:hypothetical protein